MNLDLSFPTVVYEKLMEGKVEGSRKRAPLSVQERLDLLADIDPGLAHGLRETLAYEGKRFSIDAFLHLDENERPPIVLTTLMGCTGDDEARCTLPMPA